MKKKKIILVLIILFLSFFVLGLSIYFYLLSPVSNKKATIEFEILNGTSSNIVISNLYDNNLIRNEVIAKIHFKLHKYSFKAGTYQISGNLNTKTIFTYISNSSNNIENKGITITFPEGKRITHFAKIISKYFDYTEDEVIQVINDKEYINSLIEKYWFLTNDVLNDKIYYALEGYLFPDTYNFKKDVSIKDIINVLLNETEKKLNSIRNEIESSEYNVHEILSMASIIELEGVTESDRLIISQVIHKRLNIGMSLGMDVTTYYALKEEMSVSDSALNYNVDNAYNTRGPNMAGKLPVGPICNPSLMSIKAALNPSDTDYLYFYADVKTGKVYFTKTLSEHEQTIREVG